MFLKLSSIFILFIFTLNFNYNIINNLTLHNYKANDIFNNLILEAVSSKIIHEKLTNNKTITINSGHSLNIFQNFHIITFTKTMLAKISSARLGPGAIKGDLVNQVPGSRETKDLLIAQNQLAKNIYNYQDNHILSFNNYLKIYNEKRLNDKWNYEPIHPELTNIDFNILPSIFPITTEVFLGINDRSSQSLEDINIFYLLGVDNKQQEELNKYLSTLNTISFEIFIGFLPLLLVQEQLDYLEQLINNNNLEINDKYKLISSYLNEEVPDINEILAEITLKIKEQLITTRIKLMEKLYENNPNALEKIIEAKIAWASWFYGDLARILSQIP
ncbi:MAG: hypothetical protein LBE80_05240 [Deltaproteobacteria bacterium]|jgi:hypothetical protein|nr:hypothetical protein [Deltaproteobacteria bacterium]